LLLLLLLLLVIVSTGFNRRGNVINVKEIHNTKYSYVSRVLKYQAPTCLKV